MYNNNSIITRFTREIVISRSVLGNNEVPTEFYSNCNFLQLKNFQKILCD